MPRIRITDEYSLVKRKGSANWYLEWRERGEKVRRSTGTQDAQQARVAARDLILAGLSMVDEKPADVLLVDVIERYKIQRGDALPSSDTVKRALKLWREFWADASVAEATIVRQEQFVAWLLQGRLSRGYVRRLLSVGKAALNRAWKRGEVSQVPFVELPPEGESYAHRATHAQLVTLLNASMPDHVFAYCLVRLSTGCRGDAALGLQAFQIDRDAHLVRLNPERRMQTKKYRPVVPLTDALARYLAHAKPAAHVVHWHGRPVRSIKTTWRKIIANAGLPHWFAPKVLRHTVATELRRRGVPAWDVAGLMGHRRGTTEIYAKFDPAYLGKVRKTLDAWLRELARDVPRLRALTAGSVRGQSARKQKRREPAKAAPLQRLKVVGATGIEPVTPTMSRSRNKSEIITLRVARDQASTSTDQPVSGHAGSARGHKRGRA